MNKLLFIFIFTFLMLMFGCDKNSKIDDPVIDDPIVEDTIKANKVLHGYNVRWPDLPNFNSSGLLANTALLKPTIIRYPGGTLTHSWDWKAGKMKASNNTISHPLSDLSFMANQLKCKVTFVLDIINSSLEDQIEMLKASNLPIEFIELGNELYASEYESIFPDGTKYGDLVVDWSKKLKEVFPKSKIGAVMFGRNSNDERKYNWNKKVHTSCSSCVDAYIYHIYVDSLETVPERMNRFKTAYLSNTNKELWITEYGAHSGLISQSMELADSVEHISAIALNHCLLTKSGEFTKLTTDGNALTEEGKAFSKRY